MTIPNIDKMIHVAAVRYGMIQHHGEILELARDVAALQPQHFLEIGTYQGGTFFLWCLLCLLSDQCSDGCKISIDWLAADVQPRLPPNVLASRNQRLLAHPGVHLLDADSHAPETRRTVVELLGGKPLDFLFIDGDHSAAGVAQDYETYAPLVRSGGLIAFHDVIDSPLYAADVCRVHVFWKAFKERHPDCWYEYISHGDRPEDQWGGIGVVRVK